MIELPTLVIYFLGLFLGVVQGVTEFLPVSSSGHLVFFQLLFGFGSDHQDMVAFDVFLHLATLAAIFVYFKKDILALRGDHLRMILLGSIPAGIVGVFLKDYTEVLFTSLFVVSVGWLITSALNLSSNEKLKKLVGKKEKDAGISPLSAIIIGSFQALAIVPGISRSGSTLFGGLLRGLSKQQAFRFSFLLSIPAILGANVLQLVELFDGGGTTLTPVSYFFFLAGAIGAFVSGLLSLGLLERVINSTKLHYFAAYTFVMAVVPYGLLMVLDIMFPWFI